MLFTITIGTMVMFKRFRNKKTVLLAAAVSASLFFTTGNLQAGMKEVFSIRIRNIVRFLSGISTGI